MSSLSVLPEPLTERFFRWKKFVRLDPSWQIAFFGPVVLPDFSESLEGGKKRRRLGGPRWRSLGLCPQPLLLGPEFLTVLSTPVAVALWMDDFSNSSPVSPSDEFNFCLVLWAFPMEILPVAQRQHV